MNKENDIIMIFTDPFNLKNPEGQATLIKKEKEFGSLESWLVIFTEDPNQFVYRRLIKKQNEPVQIIN